MKGLKKSILLGLSLSIGVIILILIISLIREGKEAISLKVNPSFLILSMLTIVLLWFIDGLRLYMTLKFFKVKIPLIKCIKINLVSLFLASITPFGSGGMIGKIYLLSREGLTIGGGSAVVTIIYLINIIFFLLASLSFILFFRKDLPSSFWWNKIFYLLILSITIFSFLFLFFALSPQRLNRISEKIMNTRWIKRLNEKKREDFRRKVEENIKKYHRGIGLLFKKRSLFPLLTTITLIYWFIFLNLSPLILKSLNVKFNYLRAMLSQFIFHFFITWAGTPGGSGIAEAGYSSLFSSFVPEAKIFALTFFWRFFTYYIYLIIGGVLSIGELKRINLTNLKKPPH